MKHNNHIGHLNILRFGKAGLGFFLLLSTLLLQSCLKDQEDVFDQSSSLRMQEVLDKTKAALTGNENGWTLDYYPNRELIYGGIAYAIQFKGTEATVYSEKGKKAETSLYKLTNDDGPILSFDTYNSLMHAYATPSSDEYEAKDGDFEFLIMDVQSDVITLKGKRSGVVMYMHRLNQPASEYIAAVQKTDENMYSGKYAFVINGDSILTRRVNNVFTFTDPKTGKSTDMPFITTPTGFEFKDTVNIMGKNVTAFNYSEDGIWANPSDNSIALVAIPQPLTEFLINQNWFFKASAISEKAMTFFNKAKEGSAGEGEEIKYMILGPNDILDGYSGAFGFTFISGGYGGSLHINAEALTDDIITLYFAGTGEGNGLWYFNNANYNSIIGVLTGPAGFSYNLTTDNPKSPTWIKMERTDDPDIYFTVFKEAIGSPFDK
ncbi:MAG: DUF4302 domain-containing protein [Prevotella sp.]|nr:DUF4302 domain-containing protein [Prevotella sp.]